MGQYFILDGVLKRVVSSKAAKEMILRFAAERDRDELCGQRLVRRRPHHAAVAGARRQLPPPEWVAFMDRHPQISRASNTK
jgi:hypothetical protein